MRRIYRMYLLCKRFLLHYTRPGALIGLCRACPVAFPHGLMDGSDPPGEGGMGVPMSTFPDADLGIPKGGVAPVHGRKFRIGVAAPAAVVQPQGGQRHAQAPTCPSEGRSRVHPPPMSVVHSRISVGPRRRALCGCRALGLDDTA